MRAKARKTIKTAKRTSWKQYVSKLNSKIAEHQPKKFEI